MTRLMSASYHPSSIFGGGGRDVLKFSFFFSRSGKWRRYSLDVVNPCFTAAQYVRVTVQPVANLIHLRCSSFLPHLPHLTRAYSGWTVTVFLERHFVTAGKQNTDRVAQSVFVGRNATQTVRTPVRNFILHTKCFKMYITSFEIN